MDQDKVKPVADTPQLSNQQLNEISSDSIVPDEFLETSPRIQAFEGEVQSLTMQEKKTEAEIQHIKEKFESQKRKFAKSNEAFQEEIKKLRQTVVDEGIHQKVVENQTKLLRKKQNSGILMNTQETSKEEVSLTDDTGNGISEAKPVSATSPSGAKESRNNIENVEGENRESSIVTGASTAMPNDSTVGTGSSSKQTLKTETTLKNSPLPYTSTPISPMIQPQYSSGCSNQQNRMPPPSQSPRAMHSAEEFIMFRRRTLVYIPPPFIQNANQPTHPSLYSGYQQSSAGGNRTPRPRHYNIPPQENANLIRMPPLSQSPMANHSAEHHIMFARSGLVCVPPLFPRNANPPAPPSYYSAYQQSSDQTSCPHHYNVSPQENAASHELIRNIKKDDGNGDNSA